MAGAHLNTSLSDGGNGGNDDGGDENHGDIFVMMNCVCVCVSVTKDDHFPLPSRAPKAQSETPARPCRP